LSGPLRVAFVSSHARDGGSERYLETLIEQIGIDWVAGLIALEDGPAVTRWRQTVAVEVLPVGTGVASIAAAAPRLQRAVRRMNAQIVHANGVKAAAVSSLIRTPAIWAKHDDSFDGVIGRLIARRSRAVVGVSSSALAGIGSPANGIVVPPGIEVAAVDRAAARARVDVLTDGRRPVVSMVGRLDPVKGHRDAMAATIDAAVLLVVGGDDPSHVDHARSLRRDAGSHVVFAGHRDDAIDLVAGSDLVVIPSRNEGFGLVAAEAMAVGTPVVAYAVGALPEVLGPCGTLVERGDAEALRSALLGLLDEPARRDAAAACGRDRVATMFATSRWVDAMRTVYTSHEGT